MSSFATILSEIQFSKVTYYGIRMEDDEASLFYQFVNAYSGEAYANQLAFIRSWLRKIGTEISAKENYFRFESFRGGEAKALPPPAKILRYADFETDMEDFKCRLRLYCMRINDHIVILFGGAEKTKQKAQDCPNVYPHLRLANQLCKAIDEAMYLEDIRIESEKQLIFEEDYLLPL